MKILNLNELSKYFIITEQEFIVKVNCRYLIDKDYENVIEIDEIKRTVKHICNFLLILTIDDEEEVATNIITNTMLKTKFSKMEETADSYIMELEADSKLFESNVFEKNVSNATSLFFLLMGGKIGNSEMSYGEIYQLVYDSLNDNEITGKPSVSYELLVSELMRDKNDFSKPFRISVNQNNESTGFSPLNIREIPRMQSPVSALMSEDIFDGVVSIINAAKTNKQAKLTPVEQIMLNKY